jgi:polysaccharide biosynthesis transport protein
MRRGVSIIPDGSTKLNTEVTMDGKGKQRRSIKEIVGRRRYHYLIPFVALMIVTVAVSFLLPRYYKSSSTILIEESEIPEEVVGTSDFTSFINQRLDAITQLIMSRTRLWDVIDEYKLYLDMRDNSTREEIIEEFLDNLTFETISTNIIQKGSGRPVEGTLSFTLSFEDTDPRKAQKVVSRLASLYLLENMVRVKKKLEETSRFLLEEREQLEKTLSDREARIADFKKAHIHELPDMLENNLKTAEDLENDIDRLTLDLKALTMKKSQIEGQMRQTRPYSRVIEPTGQRLKEPEDQLDALRFEYVSQKAVLSPNHPDLKILEKQTQELEKVVGRKQKYARMEQEIRDLEFEYYAKRISLGETHPDVAAIKKRIETNRHELTQIKKDIGEKQELMSHQADNPVYLGLQTDSRMLELDIRATREKLASFRAKLALYQGRIGKTPEVERSLLALTREYEHIKESHSQLLTKVREAEEAWKVDDAHKGERFTIIDEASFPGKPSQPEVPIIVFLGFVVACCISLGVVYVAELMDRSVRNADELSIGTRAPLLVTVPYIVNEKDLCARRTRRTVEVAILVVLLAAAAWSVYYYYVNYCIPFEQ